MSRHAPPVITVNADLTATEPESDGGPRGGSESGLESGPDGGFEGGPAQADGDYDEDGGAAVQDIGHSRLADLARQSFRAKMVGRRLALHRRRRHQQQQLRQEQQEQQEAKMSAISEEIQRLRREKDILANFMRLRLCETESSFSGSDVASSSGVEPSSDSDRNTRTRDGEQLLGESGQPARRRVSDVRSDGERQSRARADDLRKILRMRRRRRRLLRGHQEQYTDKTRAAAVVLGEKDISLSLRQQRRALAAARGFSLPASARPEGLTAMARAHRKAGQPHAALQLLEQALLLDPLSRSALLERSMCHTQLGQPRLALLDAEDALDLDRTDDAALFQKAQALYSMGHFEKALVVFHRGNRLRPDNPAFQNGIQQATEAILNIIGCLSESFSLTSCNVLKDWPDPESSIDSARRPKDSAPARPKESSQGYAAAVVNSDTTSWEALLPKRDADALTSGRRDEDDDDGVPPRGLCESCHTAHEFSVNLRGGEQLLCDAEAESRRIALILSINSAGDGAGDGRNAHLMRDRLPATGHQRRREFRKRALGMCELLTGTLGRALDRGAGSLEEGSEVARSSKGPSVARKALVARPAKSSSGAPTPTPPRGLRIPRPRPRTRSSARPGLERVPPSMGEDILFLEQIALDPGLQGCLVSGLAEEGVRYLKNRQVFWQRRGPIQPGSPHLQVTPPSSNNRRTLKVRSKS